MNESVGVRNTQDKKMILLNIGMVTLVLYKLYKVVFHIFTILAMHIG